MAESRVKLSKKDRLAVAWRSTFLQGSWNYERMQNGGWCFSMIPAIKKLYKTKKNKRVQALPYTRIFTCSILAVTMKWYQYYNIHYSTLTYLEQLPL